MDDCEVDVIDRNGWRKTFEVKKSVMHIGSDDQNDLVLEQKRGGGVAPRHAQLILMPGQGYRLINLGDTEIVLGDAEQFRLAPRTTTVISSGNRVLIGDFTLTFRFDTTSKSEKSPSTGAIGQPLTRSQSGLIGLALSMPQTRLLPGQSIEGAVMVSNLGDKSGVQFKLDVRGVAPECYTIGAGPILFPNATKDVLFRLRHTQGPILLAGEQHLEIHATAPEAYPGEVVVVSQMVQVQPYYAHTLRPIGTL